VPPSRATRQRSEAQTPPHGGRGAAGPQAAIATAKEAEKKKKARQAAITKAKEAEKEEKAHQAAIAKAKEAEKEAKARQAAITKVREAKEKEKVRRPRSPSPNDGEAANDPGADSMEGALGAPSDAAGVGATAADLSIDEKRRFLLDAGVHSPRRMYKDSAVKKAFHQHLCSIKPEKLDTALVVAGAVGDCVGAAPLGVDDPPVTFGAALELRAGDAAVSAGVGDIVALAQDLASVTGPAALATALASDATGAGEGMDSAPQPAFEPAASGAALPTGTAVERLEPARAATSQSPLMDPASTRLLAPGDTKEPEEVDDDEYGSIGVPVAPLVTVLEPEPPAAAAVSVAEARGRSDAREVERNRCAARLAARLAALGQQRDQLFALITQSESCLDQEKN